MGGGGEEEIESKNDVLIQTGLYYQRHRFEKVYVTP